MVCKFETNLKSIVYCRQQIVKKIAFLFVYILEELEMEQENVQEVASDDIEEVQDEPTLEPEKEKRSLEDHQEESLNEFVDNEKDCVEDGIYGEINVPDAASSLGKTFSCDECTFTERSKYAISRHKRVVHKKTSFQCKYCDKVCQPAASVMVSCQGSRGK